VDVHDLAALARVRRMAADGSARRIRQAARLSGPEVAGVLGVTAQAVSDWERGNHRPSPEVALAWLRLLDDLAQAEPGGDAA
jgi:DNA-binding transcriptional regulator YiaG